MLAINNKKQLKEVIESGTPLVFITESNPFHRDYEGQERIITRTQGNAFCLGTWKTDRRFAWLSDDKRIKNRTPYKRYINSYIYYKEINVSDNMIVFKNNPEIRIRVKEKIEELPF